MRAFLTFTLFSAAFALGPYRPICTPTQFRNAALNLTLEYQDLISNCDFLDAQMLASVIAVGRTNEADCPDYSCCQTVSTLSNFNLAHYGECDWNVTWANQEPMTATILPCGDISVFAITGEELKEDTNIQRSYEVEFIWRSRCGATGCVTNCALELVDIKYARPNCTDWETPLCINCPLKI